MNSDKQKETVYDKLNDEQKAVQIPYFVHEGVAARMERTNKRLWITVILLIVLLVGTNAGWILYESQFDTYSYDQEAHYDNDVTTSILNNGTGRLIFNGNGYQAESESQGKENKPQESNETMPDM